MKITDILVHPMGMPAERVRWTAQEITRRVELTLVEVRTDAGIVGLGEISSGPQSAVSKLLDDMTPVIVGMDPLAIDAVWSKLGPSAGRARRLGWLAAAARAQPAARRL
jgi:L-alanine-DL-glutamate epimerase-like enolase superfamily enzyme